MGCLKHCVAIAVGRSANGCVSVSAYGIEVPFSEGHFAADWVMEAACHLSSAEPHAEEKHHFGESGLGGEVVTRNHSGIGQFVACGIALLVHSSVDTLGDIYYHYSAFHRLANGVEIPLETWAVACSVGFEYDTFHSGGVELAAECAFGHTGMGVYDNHVGAEACVYFQGQAVAYTP